MSCASAASWRKRVGRELVALEFAQDQAELLGETREPRAGAEQFQFIALFREQRAQDHEAAFLIEQFGRRLVEFDQK